jgi:hypothetical protein
MVIEASDEQPAKAPPPIEVHPSGMVIEESEEQHWKA